MNTKTFIRTVSIVDTFLKVLNILILVIAAMSFVIFVPAGLVTLFNPELTEKLQELGIGYSSTATITMNGIVFGTTELESIDDISKLLPLFFIQILQGLVVMVIIYLAIRTLRKALAPCKENKVFDPEVSTNLRRLGYFVIAYGIVENVFSLLNALFMGKAYQSVLNNLKVTTANITIDLSFIWLAMFIFLLAYIFQYGSSLQKEVDETL